MRDANAQMTAYRRLQPFGQGRRSRLSLPRKQKKRRFAQVRSQAVVFALPQRRVDSLQHPRARAQLLLAQAV